MPKAFSSNLTIGSYHVNIGSHWAAILKFLQNLFWLVIIFIKFSDQIS